MESTKKIMENEEVLCLQRLEQIELTIVPYTFSEQERQHTFERLTELLEGLPDCYWQPFKMLKNKIFNLEARPPSTPPKVVYVGLEEFSGRVEAPYMEAILVTTPSDWPESILKKYNQYLALTILSCLKLYVLGKHKLEIEKALWTIRNIGSDRKRTKYRRSDQSGKLSKLVTTLPDISDYDSLEKLLANLAKKINLASNASFDRELGDLHFTLHATENLVVGIHSPRSQDTAQPHDVKSTISTLGEMDDFEQTITELAFQESCSQIGLDEQDEPLTVNNKKSVLVDAKSSHITTALRAVQSKRLAEQLAVRGLSLPCSFDQLSEWDIKHLLLSILNRLQNKSDESQVSGLLFISLLSGRPLITLQRAIIEEQFFEIKNAHPCMVINHQVAAGNQKVELDFLLPRIQDRLICPLPSVLKGWQIPETPIAVSDLNSLINDINENHQTRLTPQRIASFLNHWYINQGMDRAEVALIKGQTIKKRPRLAYTHFNTNFITENFNKYIRALFSIAGADPDLPPLKHIQVNLGSRLYLPPNVLHHLFGGQAATLEKKRPKGTAVAITFHNDYVLYVWSILSFVTGHRHVNAPLGQLTDYNSENNSWWISDKEIRKGLAARLIVIPETAAMQVTLYKDHLQALTQQMRFVMPEIEARCHESLNGSGNFLFFIASDSHGNLTLRDLTPSSLSTQFKSSMPFPGNWPRHHLGTALINEGISPELVDGWMGHEDIGEEAFGKFSMLTLKNFSVIASAIENILNVHEIRAIPGWKIR